MRPLAPLLVPLLLAATPSLAADVRATSSTVFGAWKEIRDGETVLSAPIYELLALEVSSTQMPGFAQASIVLRGWARVQAGDEPLDDHDADLQLLYARAENDLVTLQLGRQHVVSGVARMAHVDGIDTRLRLPGDLELQGWFGAIVNPHFDWDGGDRQGGARLSVDLPSNSEVGVSYARTLLGGEIAREEVGLDAVAQAGPVNVIAFGSLDLDAIAISDTRLAVRTRAGDQVYLTVDAARTVPALLLPRTSIFSVFTDASRAELGGDVEWDPSLYYRLQADGHALRVDGGSLGYRTGARFITYREPEHRSAIGLGVSRLDEGERGYVLGRVWTTLRPVSAVGVSAETHAYWFDEDINGVGGSFVGQTSLSYDIGPRVKLVATGRGGTTPLAQYLAEGFFRVLVGYGTDVTKEFGP